MIGTVAAAVVRGWRLAWLPILLIWFGFSLTTMTFVIVYTVLFPVVLNTVLGVRSVPVDLHRAAARIGAGHTHAVERDAGVAVGQAAHGGVLALHDRRADDRRTHLRRSTHHPPAKTRDFARATSRHAGPAAHRAGRVVRMQCAEDQMSRKRGMH